MKKFLSLVLALVMTMSLVTISAGAKDFADDSDIDYKEAVDVISALGIVDGYSDSSFRPDGSLTRGAAAKIICNLILGPTTASALSATTAPFKDVPTTNVFAGYITYCAQQGIISGYGDGTFRPTGSLTGNAFMKMLLGALGYDSSIEHYTGSNWQVNVVKQAIGIGLDDGNDDFVGSRTVTRQEACLYAFNMLQATMVEYDQQNTIVVGDITINTTSSRKDVANNAKDQTISDDDKMQFAEKYFDDLKLSDGTDDFARPSNVWRLKAEKIGTYPKDADAVYTSKVEAGDIYKDLSLGSTVDKKAVSVFVNGVENENASLAIRKGSSDELNGSANGVLTEVYYDKDDDTITITEVNTYVGQIAKTVKATDKRDAYVVVTPDGSKNARPANMGGNAEFETAESFDDDAYVLYTYSDATDEIKSVALAEKVEGTVTRAENADTNDNDKKALTIDGTRYTASAKIAGENLSDVSVKTDYTIYLDAYGYMIYVEEVEEIGNYALLLRSADKGTFVGKKAELVFTDGTSDVVNTAKNYSDAENLNLDYNNDDKVNSADTSSWNEAKSDNGIAPVIVTYREDSDGVYTLRAVDAAKASYTFASSKLVLKNDKAGIKTDDGTVNANSATVFVVADAGSDEDFTAYTGIKNAPSIDVTGANNNLSKMAGVYYYCKTTNSKMVTVMFILPGAAVEVEDDSNNTIFLATDSVSNLIHDEDGDYFEFQSVVNGEIKTSKVADGVKIVKQDGTTETLNNGDVKDLDGLFKSYSTDKYGIITTLKEFDKNYDTNYDTKQVLQVATGIDKVSKEYTVILDTAATPTAIVGNVHPGTGAGDYTITVDDKALYYYVDEDGNITESSYSGIAVDENDRVYAVIEDNMVQMLVICEVPAEKDVYGVKVVATGDATVKVDGTTVAAGKYEEYEKNDEDVVITVTPKPGFQIDSVKVDDNPVDLDRNNEYTIRRVTKLHEIKVETSPIAPETMQVIVTFVDSSDLSKQVGSTVLANATVNGTVAVLDTTKLTAPNGWYVDDADTLYVPYSSTSAGTVNVKVSKLCSVTLGQVKTSSGSESKNFSLSNLSDTSVASGDTVTFDIVYNGAGSSNSYTVTVDGQTFSFTKGNAETKQVTVTVTSDMTIEASVLGN